MLLFAPAAAILCIAETGRMSEWARAHFFVAESGRGVKSRPGAQRPVWCWIRMEIDRIRDAAERAASSAGVEVVDVEWKIGKQRFLRVYIDKPEGISHNDCQAVSEQLGVLLDVEDLITGPSYVLEVSSPGLDRKLSKPAEYEGFAGRLARTSTAEPVENQKFFEG